MKTEYTHIECAVIIKIHKKINLTHLIISIIVIVLGGN